MSQKSSISLVVYDLQGNPLPSQIVGELIAAVEKIVKQKSGLAYIQITE